MGWGLDELARRTGINAGHLSRIENGLRPPTEALADLCDGLFRHRSGWFREFYEDSRAWTPPGFRSWPEYENRATRLGVWAPNVVHGLLQTADYAAALLRTYPGVTHEVLKARLANRMERQRRVLLRKDPPVACLLVDHAALYREVGSAEIMAAQMARLAETAELAHVTMQVVPAVAHPATSSELIIADDTSAYAEHLAAGGVYTDDETVNSLRRVFDRLRGESYRTSESRAVIAKAGQTWNAAGASRHTPEPTAVHA